MFAGRQVVFDETLPLEMRAAGLDLDRLRAGFAELFDRAARAVQLAGYEQDDAVFERYLVCRAGGDEIVVKADWLVDGKRLINDITAVGGDVSGVSIVGIRVEAVAETGV